MAEENQLFVQWVLPHVLNAVHGWISFQRQQLGLLLVDISHYFFNHTRIHGWSARDIKVVRGMFHSWRVLSEELDEPNGAPLEHVAGAGHILDDIMRFGPSEIYWCYSYERLVSKFHKISTNNKAMEVSYIQYYSREIFTTVRKQLCIDGDGLSGDQRNMLFVHKHLVVPEGIFRDETDDVYCNLWHSKCVIEVSTIGKAYDIWDLLQNINPNACTRMVALKGILIRRKDTKPEKMPVAFHKYVLEYLKINGILGDSNSHEFSPFMKDVKCVLLERQLYRPDCDVVVERDATDATPYKANIKKFFSHEFGGEIRVFFSAIYYLHLQDEVDGRLVDKVDEITGMNLVLNNRMFPYSYTCIRPLEKLVCKFMKIQCPVHIGQAYSIAYGLRDYWLRDAEHYIV